MRVVAGGRNCAAALLALTLSNKGFAGGPRYQAKGDAGTKGWVSEPLQDRVRSTRTKQSARIVVCVTLRVDRVLLG